MSGNDLEKLVKNNEFLETKSYVAPVSRSPMMASGSTNRGTGSIQIVDKRVEFGYNTNNPKGILWGFRTKRKVLLNIDGQEVSGQEWKLSRLRTKELRLSSMISLQLIQEPPLFFSGQEEFALLSAARESRDIKVALRIKALSRLKH